METLIKKYYSKLGITLVGIFIIFVISVKYEGGLVEIFPAMPWIMIGEGGAFPYFNSELFEYIFSFLNAIILYFIGYKISKIYFY